MQIASIKYCNCVKNLNIKEREREGKGLEKDKRNNFADLMNSSLPRLTSAQVISLRDQN